MFAEMMRIEDKPIVYSAGNMEGDPPLDIVISDEDSSRSPGGGEYSINPTTDSASPT